MDQVEPRERELGVPTEGSRPQRRRRLLLLRTSAWQKPAPKGMTLPKHLDLQEMPPSSRSVRVPAVQRSGRQSAFPAVERAQGLFYASARRMLHCCGWVPTYMRGVPRQAQIPTRSLPVVRTGAGAALSGVSAPNSRRCRGAAVSVSSTREGGWCADIRAATSMRRVV